jgi:hypothetical protein
MLQRLNLVQLLRDMKNQSVNKSVVVPANCLFPDRERIHGMLSCPQFNGPCRQLTYPNLDVWYDSCDAAGVQCQHMGFETDDMRRIYSPPKKKPSTHSTSENPPEIRPYMRLFVNMNEDVIKLCQQNIQQ